MKPPPEPFTNDVVRCPSCSHGIDPHGLDPGGPCGVGKCPCMWQPNDIAADLARPGTTGPEVMKTFTGLTAAEHDAIEMTAKLWDHLAMWVVDRGPSCDADLGELAAHIHAIQRAVLANAAARAHPDLYRRLGSAIPQ